MNSKPQIVAAAILLAIAGCGSEGTGLIRVEGKVTLAGVPVEGATIVFRPESGRPSLGLTDAEGRYTLQYSRDELGALPGNHKVSISTKRDADPDNDDPKLQAGASEKIPARYNSATTLRVVVEPGDSKPVDFVLEAKPGLASDSKKTLANGR